MSYSPPECEMHLHFLERGSWNPYVVVAKTGAFGGLFAVWEKSAAAFVLVS